MFNGKKIIAMVPARIGSKRVVKKNLRLIDGEPLIAYIIKTLNKSSLFDEIYLNGDDMIFEKIAKENNIKFYHRSKDLARDSSTNDEFALDFMNNIEGDLLIQVLPTSPLITLEEIEAFVAYQVENSVDTLISVEHKQIASLYQGKTLNFDKYKKNPPSQEMEPIKAYATVLMGWDYDVFKDNMKKYSSAYHGGDGLTEYYKVSGLSTIDIDNEADFLLAEAIITAQKYKSQKTIEYYDEI